MNEPNVAYWFYCNWKGERAWRRVIPGRRWYGHTDWHLQDGWLIEAWDLEKNATRDFAVADILTIWDAPTEGSPLFFYARAVGIPLPSSHAPW